MPKLNSTQAITLCISTLSVLSVSMPIHAMDARSAALGGSAIANGQGVHGALENPASLIQMQRSKEEFHIHLGGSLDVRDKEGVIVEAADNETLLKDIEDEIDLLSDRTISCAIIDALDAVCLEDTQRLSVLAGDVLGILEKADDEPISFKGAADVGVAYTAFRFPIALHYRVSVSGDAYSDVTDNDLNYVRDFNRVFADDQLTWGELIESVPLEIIIDGQTIGLGVRQPEDTIESVLETSAMTRQQFGLSIAASFQIAGANVDIGLTPKFSELQASSLLSPIADEFDNEQDSFTDQFQDNKVSDSSFTMDVGISSTFSQFRLPFTASLVGRNLVEESISTSEGFEFKTTPQLIIGGAVPFLDFTFSADIALNAAKVDNFETQIMALGVEYDRPIFNRSLIGLRAGISHDNAQEDDATALSLGLSLGPFHIGGRVTGAGRNQAGAQISYSF